MNPNDQPMTDQPVVDQPATDQPVAASGGVPCTTCGKATSGYKCAVCGEESVSHDEAHPCGGANCQPKCVDCNEAESKCNCQGAQTSSGGMDQPAQPAM